MALRAGEKLGAHWRISDKLDPKGRSTVYRVQVKGVMEYAFLSWMSASPTHLTRLDKIQRKALEIISVDEVTARMEKGIPNL